MVAGFFKIPIHSTYQPGWYLHIHAYHWFTPYNKCQYLHLSLMKGWMVSGLSLRYMFPLFTCAWSRAEFLHRRNVQLPPCIIEVAFLDGWMTVLSDNGFPKYSWVHSDIFIMVAEWFLMQCCLFVARRSCTFNIGFCPWPLRTGISLESQNLLTVSCTVDGERSKCSLLLRNTFLKLFWKVWPKVVGHNLQRHTKSFAPFIPNDAHEPLNFYQMTC